MLKALSSLRLFFFICALLAAAFIYQTLFNRGLPIYGTAWFAVLGITLAVNIAACTLRRLNKASLHFILMHAGLVIIIAGAFATRYYRFEAQLPLHAGAAEDLAHTETAAYKLPFAVELKSFRLEYYAEPQGLITVEENGRSQSFAAKEGAVFSLAGGAKLKVLRVVRDFGLKAGNEVVEKSPYWNNPAVRLEIALAGKKQALWFFSNFPGMHGVDLPFRVAYSLEHAEIKNYYSTVKILSETGPEVNAEIGVNKPLKYGAYTLYQTSYDPSDAEYTLLTITMDRGVWVVYLGFALFLTGILLWLRK